MKDKITQAGLALFEKQGFSTTSIQDICNAIGVTKGTFYYYYDSKETLLMEIHLRYIDDILEKQNVILNDQTSNYQTKLFNLVYMLLHDIEQRGASARIFFRELRHLSPERVSHIVEKRTAFRLNIERLLREGIEAGVFRSNLDASIATFGVLGMANWSYEWFQPSGEKSDREVAQTFVDMILGGIEMENSIEGN